MEGTLKEELLDLALKGKKAVVTGGTRGIGRAIAEALAAEGVDVAICARSRGDLDEAVTALARRGVKAWGKGLCTKPYIRAWKHNGDTSYRPRITICTIEGCGGKVYAKGLCAKHYMRALRHRGDTSDRPRVDHG